MENIKHIIFDLGGIFLNLNYQRTKQLFIDYGVTEFDEYFTQHHADTLFEDLEKGLITPEAFYDAFRKNTNTQLTNDQIKEAWNAMLVSFSPERIVWLKSLREKYNIYLFSNTNQIHYEAIMALYKRDVGDDSFNDIFVKAYYSHEMQLRKPYPESFLHIIDAHQLNPSETLFIDDTIKNIEGANAVGLNTIHLVAPQTVLDLAL